MKVARGSGDCVPECCYKPLLEAIRVLLEETMRIPSSTLDRLLAQKSEAFARSASGYAMANELSMKLLKAGIRAGGLPLSVCSDIIRLFGEPSEYGKCKELRGSSWAQHERGKDKLKPEPTFLKPEDAHVKGWSPSIGPLLKEDWYGHRRRIDLEEKTLPITRSETPCDHVPKEIKRGVDKFKLEDQSVISIIDGAFGAEPKARTSRVPPPIPCMPSDTRRRRPSWIGT